jgi:hypothetical protein
MITLKEIENAVEQLPVSDFIQLAVWIDRRRQALTISGLAGVRHHSAFLTSYAPQDEGLYDDAETR